MSLASSDWKVGQALPELPKPEITKEQLAEYAEASGDNNPIHLDEELAQSSGFPTVVAHGMILMAFMADHIRQSFPENKYQVKRFRTRFRKVTFAGDTLTCEGSVKALSEDQQVSLALAVRNQRGEVAADAVAEVVATH